MTGTGNQALTVIMFPEDESKMTLVFEFNVLWRDFFFSLSSLPIVLLV